MKEIERVTESLGEKETGRMKERGQDVKVTEEVNGLYYVQNSHLLPHTESPWGLFVHSLLIQTRVLSSLEVSR